MDKYSSMRTIARLSKAIIIICILFGLVALIDGVILFSDKRTMEIGLYVCLTALFGTFMMVVFWVGFSKIIDILLDIVAHIGTARSMASATSKEDTGSSELEIWKRENPGKSLNDFYAQKRFN